MCHSFILASLLGSLAVTCVGASPIGEYYQNTTPNYPFAEGPGFKLCKKTPIRYNPKHFVCHDNEIICPILDQGSEDPHAMQRCGESCFDDRLGSCENNKFIPSPPKRSWELGVDLAFAHHIQHAPSTSEHSGAHSPVHSRSAAEADETAAQALLTRYANAFSNTTVAKAALYKRYNDAVAAETQKYLETEQKREDDQYLHLEKRWRRASMKKDPIVYVKQTWDPRQRIQEENSQGTIENGKSRSMEVLSTGEEFVDKEEMDRKVVGLPIRRPIVVEDVEEEDAEEEEEECEEEGEEDSGYVADKEFKVEDVEVEESEDEELAKRGLEEQFEEQMKELEKVLAAVI